MESDEVIIGRNR